MYVVAGRLWGDLTVRDSAAPWFSLGMLPALEGGWELISYKCCENQVLPKRMEQASFFHLDMLFRGLAWEKLICCDCFLPAQLNTPFPFSKGEMEKGSTGLFFWVAKAPHWVKMLLSWIAKPFVRSISF